MARYSTTTYRIPGTSHIEFRMTNPSVQFYVCDECLNHIALFDDYRVSFLLLGTQGGAFTRAFNLRVEGPRLFMFRNLAVAATYCRQCGVFLGVKFAVVPPELQGVIERSWYFLIAARLCKWNGVSYVPPMDNNTHHFGLINRVEY